MIPKLICQDNRNILPSLKDESIDLVVTSPPYNIGVKYKSFRDTAARVDYLAWCKEWAEEVKRVMTTNGSFFLNVGACPTNPLLPYQLISLLTEEKENNGERIPPTFILQNTFHWIKSITIKTTKGDQISAGHFKPINSDRYVNDLHEFVFHLTKTGAVKIDRRGAGVPYADKSNIARFQHTGGQDLRCRGNTWFIPYKTIQSRDRTRPHPATFPPELAEQCIRVHGNPEKTRMLDPFVGIGSSAIAAKRLGILEFIGIDNDPFYIEIAKERYENEKSL